MVVTINIYNTTPFLLDIVVQDKEGTVLEQFSSDPSHGRVVRIRDAKIKYPKLSVSVLDSSGRKIKEAWFHTYYDYSWIVTDAEIRRQRSGRALCVADSYRDSEREANFRSGRNYKWSKCNDIKQYDWTSTSTELCLHSGNLSCPAPQLIFLKELSRQSNVDQSSVDVGLNQTIHVFNDSPYFLDIRMDNSSTSKLYWSDPERNRLVRIQSEDRYPFVVINAVDAAGQRVKHASFYSFHDYSWIVSDECIVRQEPGSAPFVACQYKEAEVEEAFERQDGYKWNRCNEIKRYGWTSDSKELALYAAEEVSEEVKNAEEERSKAAWQTFVDARQKSGLIRTLPDETIVADLIIEWITFSNLRRRPPGQLTVITAADSAIQELVSSYVGRPATSTSSSHRRLPNLESFRLDFLRGQSHYDECRIVYGDRRFVSVLIHQDIRSLPTNKLRHAFRTSLSQSVEIWIASDGDAISSSPSPQRPPDSPTEIDFTFLMTFVFHVTELHLWVRR